jgi:hypothetical protein
MYMSDEAAIRGPKISPDVILAIRVCFGSSVPRAMASTTASIECSLKSKNCHPCFVRLSFVGCKMTIAQRRNVSGDRPAANTTAPSDARCLCARKSKDGYGNGRNEATSRAKRVRAMFAYLIGVATCG